MRVRPWARALVATTTALVAGLTVLVPAGPAAAAPLRCSDVGGRITSTTVPGDLHVDESCVLVDVRVTGGITTDLGTTLTLRLSEVSGDVAGSGSISLEHATVLGGLRLDHPGVHVVSLLSHVRRSIRGTADYVLLHHTDVDGAVNLTLRGQLKIIENGRVGGWVNTNGGAVEVFDTDLGRGLTVTGATGEVVVCSVDIGATVTVAGARGPVLLGGVRSNGSLCTGYWHRGGNVVVGDVVLTDNTGTVRVGGETRGDALLCSGNTSLILSVTEWDFRRREGQCA